MTPRLQSENNCADVMLNYSTPSIASKYVKAGGYIAVKVFFKSKRGMSSRSFPLEFIFTETA